jgi:L-rhamnose isomerase/sugar isomerase
VIRAWRRSKGLPEDPLLALRESGYLARIEKERKGRSHTTQSYA